MAAGKAANSINDPIRSKLREIIPPERLRFEEPLSRHTSFRTGGPADCFVSVCSEEELSGLLSFLTDQGIPRFLLGRGSNLLVSDSGFRGVVIRLSGEFEEIRPVWEGQWAEHSLVDITFNPEETQTPAPSSRRIFCGAGASLASLASFALEHSLTGLEFASGIPGSLGGGIIMNAGAYGGELGDFVENVRILRNGEVQLIPKEEMEFSYRTSRAKREGFPILSAEFTLSPGEPEEIRGKMRELNEKRREKQPLEYPSAGSTFKRPQGNFAGRLIEEAELSGFSVGGARVSEKHCGFLINSGNATSADIYRLIRLVQEKVQQASGILLEPEVIFLGDF